jgi:hypothetical protein
MCLTGSMLIEIVGKLIIVITIGTNFSQTGLWCARSRCGQENAVFEVRWHRDSTFRLMKEVAIWRI